MPTLRMFAPSPRFSRVVVGILGCSHLALGYYTTQLTYLPGAEWFGLVFLVAAVACFLYAAWQSPTAAIYAGAATVTAYALRIGALFMAWADDEHALTFAQFMSGVIVFATLILAWGPVFWKVTVPNAAIRHAARRSERE